MKMSFVHYLCSVLMTLLWLSISTVSSELIQVVVPAGLCVAFIMKDGLAYSCYTENKVVSVGDDVLRYDEIVVFIYEPNTFDIVSLEHIKISPQDRKYSLRNKDTDAISVMFPKQNDVLTTMQVDFSFYFHFVRAAPDPSSNSSDSMQVNGQQQFICMKVTQLNSKGGDGIIAESSMICLDKSARSYSGQLAEGAYRTNW